MLFETTLEGTTPLICNKFGNEINPTGETSAQVGEKLTPKEESEQRLYIGEFTGEPMLPGPNFFSCLIEAGKFFKVGKSKVTTQKTSLVPAGVGINEIEIPIVSKEGWTVDTRAVRIPSTGGRILRHRPIFNDWRLSLTMELDPEVFTQKLLRQLVDAAGKKIGLGDFRPACKGPYGRFVVVNWANITPKIEVA